jgi:hypothetical protein
MATIAKTMVSIIMTIDDEHAHDDDYNDDGDDYGEDDHD